jgi:transposase-like protein
MGSQRIIKRYSEAFKHKVVNEIESGQLTIAQATKLYGIGGSTIHQWLKKLGKNHLLAKVVRIEMANELDRLKALEKEKQALEHALAQAQLKILKLESDLAVTREHFGVDERLKKNSNTKA